MDFSTQHDAPFSVTIDGTTYQLPRFLLPQFKEWADVARKERVALILEQFTTPQERAQHLSWWEPPIQDIAMLVDRAREPGGIEFVVNRSMDLAGVPADIRQRVLRGDALQLRELALQLTMASAVKSNLKAQGPVKDAPAGESQSSSQPSASESKNTSDGSPATGDATTPASDTSTTAATPTA